MTPHRLFVRRRAPAAPPRNFSVLAWPAWLRLLAVLPAVALLWLAVGWALQEIVA